MIASKELYKLKTQLTILRDVAEVYGTCTITNAIKQIESRVKEIESQLKE